jgi:multicomponent Na+:H+ antiporter subunit D
MITFDTTPWAAWTIMLPLMAAVLAFFFRQHAVRLGMVATVGLPLLVTGTILQLLRQGPQRHPVGGWGAPLGIDLYTDGLSVFMLSMTVLVGMAVSIYAVGYFRPIHPHVAKTSASSLERALFWPLWLLLWAALNGLFLSADAFNLYVALELLGISAVALTALTGEFAAVVAATRYLLVSLLGSLCYLLGVGLIYAAFSTLDLIALGQVVTSGPVTWVAITLMTAGLALKTALFPLHFWLPPAHANAPAPVSALLSALVVKASFYILVRIWFVVFPAAIGAPVTQFLGVLGTAAIVWGSAQALLAQRIKILVAYSTVAQLGYLFLAFPLAQVPGAGLTAWCGGLFFAFSHACAKTVLFLVAGIVVCALGHDRIDDIDGLGQVLPVPVLAFALAGVSLMGLPPSGGFIAKWMLLNAAFAGGQWWWAVVIVFGGLLSAAYVFRILARALKHIPSPPVYRPVPRSMEWTVLALSLVTLVLGVFASYPLALLQIGAPVSGSLLSGGTP